MTRSFTIIAAAAMALAVGSCSAPAEKKNYALMADSEIARQPNAAMTDVATTPKWDYTQGLLMQSIIDVSAATGDDKYWDYAYSFADTMVFADGTIRSYNPAEYNIDRVNPGKMLFKVWDRTGEQRMRDAIELLRGQMRTHPRTSGGSFWHKNIYPHQVWLDGIYMACPFLAQYAERFDEPELFDDVARQIIDIHKIARDPATGLYYHGWDESREQRWSNPETGLSPNFWSRSIGWYMMAMVDALDFLPADHPHRAEIIDIFAGLCEAVEKIADPATGMWWQVTDQGSREGNYLEASASIMFIYSWVKGAQKGYLDAAWAEKGATAYDRFLDHFVTVDEAGLMSINDCCAVSGLGGSGRYRDGTFEYYISEPIRSNDAKAVGPFIMTSILLDR